MKVLLINGSPNEKGCTYTALSEVASTLEAEGIDTEIFWLGLKPISGCTACEGCRELGKCVIDDVVNDVAARIDEFDGFIFGSPVHFSSASGAMTSFMDRLFFANTSKFAGKPGAVVVSCRRSGLTATFNQLNMYLMKSEMPVATSSYWNNVHGAVAEEVFSDKEGLQTMRNLARNLSWLIKSIEAGKAAGIAPPAYEHNVYTNFVR